MVLTTEQQNNSTWWCEEHGAYPNTYVWVCRKDSTHPGSYKERHMIMKHTSAISQALYELYGGTSHNYGTLYTPRWHFPEPPPPKKVHHKKQLYKLWRTKHE